jgi:hypothetical protein
MTASDEGYSKDVYYKGLEDDLTTLTAKYEELRRTVDNRFTTPKYRLYSARVGACIAAFIVTFSVSFAILPMLSYMESSNLGLFSVIIGMSAGIIMGIIFVVDDNLKTQRLNEKLAAKSYEIKIQRNKILSYLQRKGQQL